MKRIVFLILLLILSINALAQSQQPPFGVTTVVSVPYLSPGDRNIGLEFTVQNNMEISIDNVKIYLFLSSPFSASIPPNNKLGEITYPGYLISSGGAGDEYTEYFNLASNTAHKTFFKIDVDRNAKYGTYDLPYTIFYGQNKQYSGKISLTIMGDTLIDIKNVSLESDNSQIEPGDVFKIAVSFENVGDNEVKWLKLTLNPMDKALIPLSSDSEHVFRDIQAGSKGESEFWFSLEKDAIVKNYPIDLILIYLDERGTTFNETKLVGIVAAGRANLDIAKKTTDPARLKENEPFSLTVKIENTGTGDAKGVTARLESMVEGDTLAYLGEIKKDDYSNAIFSLDTGSSGKKTGILNITYEDDLGRHEIQKELILIVNKGDGENPFLAVIGLIVIAAIFFFWKKRKH
jgi:LPXTG-motif cell wall-anchored protein